MKDKCAEHKREGWVNRRTTKGLKCLKHGRGGWEDRRQGWATRDLECIKHEQGGTGDEGGRLRGGSSYVHDYLHKHNICYVKNIYHQTLSKFLCPLTRVLMHERLSYRPPPLLHSPSCICQYTFQRACLCTPSSIHMASPCKTCPGSATKHPGLIGKTSTVH